MTDTIDRIPPSDFGAEQGVLGSMLMEAGAVPLALSVVTADDFYRTYHRQIFAAMIACHERREPVDLVTVAAELRRRGQLEEVGNGEYLTALLGEVPTAAHVMRYAGIVAEKSILRRMITEAGAIQATAYGQPENVGAALAEAGTRFTELYRSRVGGGVFGSLAEQFCTDAQALWDDAYSDAGEVSAARWGISPIDEYTGGLESQRYVVIKAETKHGKSQLLRQVVLETARRFRDDRSGRLVLAFVLEEGRTAWVRKAWAWLAQVDSRLLLQRGRGGRHFERHPEAQERLVTAQSEWLTFEPVLRVTARVRDIRQLESTCRALACTGTVGLVAVDYFQLLAGGEGQTEEQQYSYRSNRLQLLADDLDCPVVVPSQITVDSRTGRVNTKGARAIEHNASMVVQWVRDEEDGQLQDRGRLGCLIDRNGPGFSPQRIITRKDCGRFWGEQDFERLQQQEVSSWPNN